MSDAWNMMWDMFWWQVLSAMVVGAGCAALGVFVILRRVVFVGIALAQGAALGVALALAVGVAPFWGAAALSLLIVALLASQKLSQRFGRDAVLGVLFVAASAAAPLIVAHSAFHLHDVTKIFYGDLTLMGYGEALAVVAVGVVALLFVSLCLRGLVVVGVDRDFARSRGVRIFVWDGLYFLALAVVVAVAARSVGSVLVFAYLIVAPLIGLTASRTLKTAVLISSLAASAATLLGFWLAILADLTANLLISVILIAILALLFPTYLLIKRFLKSRSLQTPSSSVQPQQ